MAAAGLIQSKIVLVAAYVGLCMGTAGLTQLVLFGGARSVVGPSSRLRLGLDEVRLPVCGWVGRRQNLPARSGWAIPGRFGIRQVPLWRVVDLGTALPLAVCKWWSFGTGLISCMLWHTGRRIHDSETTVLVLHAGACWGTAC